MGFRSSRTINGWWGKGGNEIEMGEWGSDSFLFIYFTPLSLFLSLSLICLANFPFIFVMCIFYSLFPSIFFSFHSVHSCLFPHSTHLLSLAVFSISFGLFRFLSHVSNIYSIFLFCRLFLFLFPIFVHSSPLVFLYTYFPASLLPHSRQDTLE